MTRRQWSRFKTAFIVGVIFLLAAANQARSQEWKSTVTVGVWCYSLDVIKEMVKSDDGDAVAMRALKTGACEQYPLGVPFKPQNIAAEFPLFGDGPAVVVFGTLPGEVEAYVVVPVDRLGDFKAKKTSYQTA